MPQPPGHPQAPATAEAVYGAETTGDGVRFVQPGDGRDRISVAGDFNDWSPTATPLSYDATLRAHLAVVEIPPGRYRYPHVVDGTWKDDIRRAHV